MMVQKQLSEHLNDVYFGGNWTASSLKEHLTDLDWQTATKTLHGCNSILALTYHIHYFVRAVMPVLRGEALHAKDALSFDHPDIDSQQEWESFLATIFEEVKIFIKQIDALPETKLFETFVDKKYGTYYRNIQGLIEHTHYHLGQIVILKKILVHTQ